MVKKRLDFECWNCNEVFNFLIHFEGSPQLTVYCAHCGAAGVADFDPYNKTGRPIFETMIEEQEAVLELLTLPAVIPTSEPAEDNNEEDES